MNETKKNIYIWAEQFRAEPTAPLHYETENEQSKVIRNQT